MNAPNKKTRIAMVCPCCGGEVTHQRYGFDMIAVSPRLVWTKWYVCAQCEAALTGADAAARDATVRAFEAHLEGSEHDTRH
jgi:hypothetical protein